MSSMTQVVRTNDRTLRTVLAVCSIAAGLIHAAVVREHLEEDWVFGAFFIVVAALQIVWAIPISLDVSVIPFASAGILGSGALVSRSLGGVPNGWPSDRSWSVDAGAGPDSRCQRYRARVGTRRRRPGARPETKTRVRLNPRRSLNATSLPLDAGDASGYDQWRQRRPVAPIAGGPSLPGRRREVDDG